MIWGSEISTSVEAFVVIETEFAFKVFPKSSSLLYTVL